LAGIKHGCSEAIEIGLGDTREVCWLGDGSTLHVVELEKCCDHHLVVKWQQKWLARWHQDVQLVNCIGSHQDKSTIEFSDALCYESNIDWASGKFMFMIVQRTFTTCIPYGSDLAGNGVLLLLLPFPKDLGPDVEVDQVVVQVLWKTFHRPLQNGNYLSIITTVNLINCNSK
jgi:hypothetical protein